MTKETTTMTTTDHDQEDQWCCDICRTISAAASALPDEQANACPRVVPVGEQTQPDTMTVSWHPDAVQRAKDVAAAILDAGDPDRGFYIEGKVMTWLDLACLLDGLRQATERPDEPAPTPAASRMKRLRRHVEHTEAALRSALADLTSTADRLASTRDALARLEKETNSNG